jgi:alpha-tubulin suppressor-like RCC1 family protein
LEVPDLLNGRHGIDSLSATDDMFAAKMNDGHVVTWGYDENGKVMDLMRNLNYFVTETGLGKNVIKICSTSSTFAILTSDGHAYTWGMHMMRSDMWKGVQNVYTTQWGTFIWMQTNTLEIDGQVQLGNSGYTYNLVNTITDVTKITHCKSLLAALTSGGIVYIWGRDGYLGRRGPALHYRSDHAYERNVTDIHQRNDSIIITRSDGKFLSLTPELVKISVDDDDVLRWEEPSSFKTSKMYDGSIEFGHIQDIMSYRLPILDLEFKLPTSEEVDYGRADQFIVAGDLKQFILFARTTNGTLLKWNSKKGKEQSEDEQLEDELFIEQGTVLHEHVEDVQHTERFIAVLLRTGHVIVYNIDTMDVVFNDHRYYSNISKISSHFHTDIFVLTLQTNKEVVLLNLNDQLQTKIIYC